MMKENNLIKLINTMEIKLDKIINDHYIHQNNINSIKKDIAQNTKDIKNGNEALLNHMEKEEIFWDKIEAKFESKLDSWLFWKIFWLITTWFMIVTSFLFNEIKNISNTQNATHDWVIELQTLIKK